LPTHTHEHTKRRRQGMTSLTTTASRAEPTTLTARQRQQLQLPCLTYLANGMSVLDIAKQPTVLVVKDCPSRIVWSGFQGLTTQRITVRLGLYSAGTVRDLT
jgi:hypothetical protein